MPAEHAREREADGTHGPQAVRGPVPQLRQVGKEAARPLVQPHHEVGQAQDDERGADGDGQDRPEAGPLVPAQAAPRCPGADPGEDEQARYSVIRVDGGGGHGEEREDQDPAGAGPG